MCDLRLEIFFAFFATIQVRLILFCLLVLFEVKMFVMLHDPFCLYLYNISLCLVIWPFLFIFMQYKFCFCFTVWPFLFMFIQYKSFVSVLLYDPFCLCLYNIRILFLFCCLTFFLFLFIQYKFCFCFVVWPFCSNLCKISFVYVLCTEFLCLYICVKVNCDEV